MISISAAALILTFATSAPKTTIFGDVITSWSDYGHGQYTLVDAEGMSFDQADLGLYTYFNSWGIQLITVMLELRNGIKGAAREIKVTPSRYRLPAQLRRVFGVVSR